MARVKLLVDTNVLIDYLSMREPFYEKARLLMIGGYVGEFELWMSSSQMTDLVYILSEGGRRQDVPTALRQLKGLRSFVNVYPVGTHEIDAMLQGGWDDPEDHLMAEVALSLKADAILTRNESDYAESLIRAMNPEVFFAWMKNEHNLDYEEVEF